MRLILLLALASGMAIAQQSASIRVNFSEKLGSFEPVYSYFGYDEPNYTDKENGSKLVAELGSLSSSPVYIRSHFLLASGDGTAGLKWGSTNAYTEDSSG